MRFSTRRLGSKVRRGGFKQHKKMNKEFDIKMVKKHLLEYSKICQAHSESLNENTVHEKIVALGLLKAGISEITRILENVHEQQTQQHNGTTNH